MKKFALIPALVAIALSASPAFAAANGKQIFTAKCVMCHGAKGLGDGPAGKALKARNLVTGKYENGRSAAGIMKTLNKGLGAMPAFKGQLKPDEMKAVTSYVIALQKGGSKAKAKPAKKK